MRNSAKQRGVHGENATPGTETPRAGSPGNQATLTMTHLENPNPKTQVHAGETRWSPRTPLYAACSPSTNTAHKPRNHPMGNNKPVKTKEQAQTQKTPNKQRKRGEVAGSLSMFYQ